MEGQTGESAADGLFDYDLDFEDIIRDRNETGSNPAAAATEQQPPPGANHVNQQKVDDTNLGLDEEIQVTKKRQPVPKLDEEKLLSQKGIPRLRKKARKLNLHGKGREYEDTAKLLNFFQLWLDDLHPRVKFADGLAIIEKLGHSKRLITMRKEWINEATRQRQGYSDTPRESSFNFTQNEPPNPTGNNTFGSDMRDSTAMEQDNDLFVDEGNNGNLSANVLLPTNEHEEDDDLDALLAEPSMQDLSINNTHMPRNKDTDMPLADRNTNSAPPRQQPSTRADEPPEDDLDALLAEEDEMLSSLKNKGNQQQQPAPDDFEDDWEAMREFGM